MTVYLKGDFLNESCIILNTRLLISTNFKCSFECYKFSILEIIKTKTVCMKHYISYAYDKPLPQYSNFN